MPRLTQLLSDARHRAWLGGGGWLLVDRLTRLALGVAVNVVLARSLGPADFGRFAAALTLAALFVPLSTLGSERIVVRELARRAATETAVLRSLGPVRLAGGIAGWLLATLIAGFSMSGRSDVMVMAWIGAGNVFLAFDTVDWTFQARGKFQPGTLARLAAFVIGAVTKIVLALAGAGLPAIAAVVAVEMALSGLFQSILWYAQGGRLVGAAFDRPLVVKFLRAGAPLLAAELAVWAFQRLDLLLLARISGAEEAGIYSAAQRFAQVGFFLPVFAVQIFSPEVARAPSDQAALALVQRIMNGLVLAGLLLAVATALASSLLVRSMFGPSYTASAGVLSLLAWNNVFVFMGCAHSLYLVNRGAEVLSLRLAATTAVVSVTLNLVLIPILHARGAAIASLATYALTTVFGVSLFAVSRPLLKVNLRALTMPWAGWSASPRDSLSHAD